jgi:dextranase
VNQRLGLRRFFHLGGAMAWMLLAGACAVQSEDLEVSLGKPVQIVDLEFDKAFYRPQQPFNLTVHLTSEQEKPGKVWLVAALTHLAKSVETYRQEVTLSGGEQTLEITLLPPPDAPRGYGLDLFLETQDGDRLGSASRAFDVLNHWTESPRYGFLSEFAPGRLDSHETMRVLTRYHINALQFYDWMYRHEQLLTPQEPYIDLLGRQLSRATVDNLIQAAHDHNIAAMPYTAVYGSSLEFYERHPEWAVFDRKGQPVLFGENFMAIMDPRPGSPWTAHLLAQFEDVLKNTAFDGIHIDQYGDPKEGFDRNGQRYDLAPALADFINTTGRIVREHRQPGAVVFNAVTNWPIEAVAPADQDIVYIEVWDPYNWLVELHQLVVQAQGLGNGKPVVLAAYIDPAHEHNMRLMDAIIFASGGGRIELGERAGSRPGVLADPYFPQYQAMSPDLSEAVQRLYDFSVRYQDVIGPRAVDATPSYHNRIRLQGQPISPNALNDTVFPVVRDSQRSHGSGRRTAISLINLLGVKNPEWKPAIPAAPLQMEAVDVLISGVVDPVAKVWSASPDSEDLAAHVLDFKLDGGELTFQVPSIEYWTMIVIEWSE